MLAHVLVLGLVLSLITAATAASCSTIATTADFCGGSTGDSSKVYNSLNEQKLCAGSTCNKLTSADITTCCQDAVKCSSIAGNVARIEAVCGKNPEDQYDETKKEDYCKTVPCGSYSTFPAGHSNDVSFAMIPS